MNLDAASGKNKTLRSHYDEHEVEVQLIVQAECVISLHSKADEKGNPVSSDENPTRTLKVGDMVEIQGCGKTNGVKLIINGQETIWVSPDELYKISVAEITDNDISLSGNRDANTKPAELDDPAVRDLVMGFSAALHSPGQHPHQIAVKTDGTNPEAEMVFFEDHPEDIDELFRTMKGLTNPPKAIVVRQVFKHNGRISYTLILKK